MGVTKGDTRSLDYGSYAGCTTLLTVGEPSSGQRQDEKEIVALGYVYICIYIYITIKAQHIPYITHYSSFHFVFHHPHITPYIGSSHLEASTQNPKP